MKKSEDRKIYVFDFETDPFLFDRVPMPFSCGLYDGTEYKDVWGEPEIVIDWLLNEMELAPEGAIFFAHNGGKFDFHFFKEHFEGDLKIIGARIAKARVAGKEIRDSFSLIPVGLGKYKKTDIEYWKMEPEYREQFKDEILSYLRDDCIYLYELVSEFVKEFGLHLTMATAALKELQKFHPVARMTGEGADTLHRKFYFGGRVECIEKGILSGTFKCYDVNSMYPAVMKNELHPISADWYHYIGKSATTMLERCDFAIIDAVNYGAFPRLNDEGRLSFREPSGKFHVTGHEVRAALETGMAKVLKVHMAFKAKEHSTFAEFVEHYYTSRQAAKARGDDLRVLFYKLIMNSSYGKFAQNPEHFKDWEIVDNETMPLPWVPQWSFDNGLIIYSRPTEKPHHIFRHNVMTAASITGAARAQLMRGLHNAVRPVYCDTDSIVCQSLNDDLDETKLGAWKLEAEGDSIAIAGKKMYSIRKGDEIIKTASKGVRINSDEVYAVARGEHVKFRNDAPTFNLSKAPRFIERTVRAT